MPFQMLAGVTICHYIDGFLFRVKKLWGGSMKARLEKSTSARRFSLICALLLVTAAWAVSDPAAQQQAEQAAVQQSQPPDSPGPPQAAQPGQQAPEPVPAPPEQTSQAQAEQPAQPPAREPSPSPAQPQAQAPSPEQTSQAQTETDQLAGPAPPQTPDAAAPQPETAGKAYPPGYIPLKEKATSALMSANFTFYPIKTLDPFVPFLAPETSNRLGEDEEEPKNTAPLTPLQKMTVSEIERGLKAITWGELGRKAVIEDSTGRGYIVSVGTPAGEHSGVITQISNDHLVIQQEIWDRKAKKRFPQEYVVKLVKKTDNQKQ